MFSPSPCFTDPLPRPRVGTRRGGPVLLREVMPAALDRLLERRSPHDDPAGAELPSLPRRPPYPRAA